MSHIAEGDLHAYLDGAVLPDTPGYDAIQAHLAFCSDCRVRLDEAAELHALAQEALRELRTAVVAVPPFHEIVSMSAPEPVSGSPARRPLLGAIAAAAIVVLAFGLGWMGRDVANLRGPGTEVAVSGGDDDPSPDASARNGATAAAGDSGSVRGTASGADDASGQARTDPFDEPREPGARPTAPTGGGGQMAADDGRETPPAPGLPRVALARPSIGRVPSARDPLRSTEPRTREASATSDAAEAPVRGEDTEPPGRYGREAVGERVITPDPARPRPSAPFPWPSLGDPPRPIRAPLSVRDSVSVRSRGEERGPPTVSRERAESHLGSPLVVVSGLPSPTAWERLEEAARRVRTTQVLPDGTSLELTQWRTGEARRPETDQRSVEAIDPTLPLAPRVVGQGQTDDGRTFIHVELWSGQAVLAIASPLPLDAMLPLVARLEAIR